MPTREITTARYEKSITRLSAAFFEDRFAETAG
jgi:hypothetical protein